MISLGIPGSGTLKASLLTVKENLPKWNCSIISFKCVCPLNGHASLSEQKKMNLSFTPHTGLSSTKGRQSPIDQKQPFDSPSGLRNKSIWMGEASGDKENKNRKQKKKLALKEIRSPNNYKLTLVPTVYC